MYVEDYFRRWGDLSTLFKKIPEIVPRSKYVVPDEITRRMINYLKKDEPEAGLELATTGLQNQGSTN